MEGYCIYIDEISDDLSIEHVIPLSLGGHDKFSIHADRKYNNFVGSKIDGAIANDFLTLFDRDKQGAKGHSGKHPEPLAKRATLEDGTPVQVAFSSKGLRVYNLKERRYLNDQEQANRTIKCSGIVINIDADIKFVAKVAMSAGFYAYGDLFKYNVQHEQLRKISNAERLDQVKADVRLFSRFQSEDGLSTENIAMLQILQMATQRSKHSCVLLIPGNDCFGVAVGILGTFMGMINVPANCSGMPNDGDYRQGHVVIIRDGSLERRSFRSLADELLASLDNDNIMLNPISEPASTRD